MTDTRRIAESVRTARGLASMSQADLAEAARVSDETISRIERGAYEPSVSTLVALAKALDVSLDHLVGREGIRAPVSKKGRHAPKDPVVARLMRRLPHLTPEGAAILVRVAELLPDRAHEARGKGARPPRRRV
jgi:repressor LexA